MTEIVLNNRFSGSVLPGTFAGVPSRHHMLGGGRMAPCLTY